MIIIIIIIIIIFPVISPLALVAVIGALIYLLPSKYKLLLRYAVPTFGYTIFLALYLYFSFILLLRYAMRPFPSFKNYISLILV
jgi:hypothetical protein